MEHVERMNEDRLRRVLYVYREDGQMKGRLRFYERYCVERDIIVTGLEVEDWRPVVRYRGQWVRVLQLAVETWSRPHYRIRDTQEKDRHLSNYGCGCDGIVFRDFGCG